MNDAANEDAVKYTVDNSKITASKTFEYKTKIIGRTPVYNYRINIKSVTQFPANIRWS